MTCDGCGLRTHIKWCNVSPVEYVNFQNSNDHTWLCSNCEEYVLNVSDTRNDTRMITEENYMKDLADKVQSCASKEIKVTHLNVRSLRNKIDEIRCLQVFCRFDIIAITESHLDNSITTETLNWRSREWNLHVLAGTEGGAEGLGFVYYTTLNILKLYIEGTCTLHVLRHYGYKLGFLQLLLCFQ